MESFKENLLNEQNPPRGTQVDHKVFLKKLPISQVSSRYILKNNW